MMPYEALSAKDLLMGYMQFENDGTHKKLNLCERAGYCVERCLSFRRSRSLVLLIVFIALFLDNMLLTVVVPVMPNFLLSLDRKNFNQTNNCSTTLIGNQSTDSLPYSFVRSYTSRHPSWTLQIIRGRDYLVNATCWKRSEEAMHDRLSETNIRIGVMFASKSMVQLISNPFVGPLTNRIGYSIPMFTGFLIMFISTLIFAFGQTYAILLIARALQGVGSACSSVSGMGMLATHYTEEKERGNAFAFALGGLALGVLVGPPFGGIMYQFVGKPSPFLVLAMLALIDGLLQLVVLKPGVKPEPEKGAPLVQLLRDPYILIAAGSITFGNMGIAMLEPSLPLWMHETMGAPEWQQGIAFLPCSISYLIGTNVFGPLAHRMGRWLSAGIGMLIIGVCLICIPFSTNLGHLILPNFGLGFAIGMVDSAMMPLMGYLVDLRHVSVYGSVYAIADVAFCLGFAVGPALSGSIVKAVGFKWMIWCTSIFSLLYAPLNLFLRNPPAREEKMGLVMKSQCPQQYSVKSDAKDAVQNGESAGARSSNGNIPEKEENYYSD